jgi:glycosidase
MSHRRTKTRIIALLVLTVASGPIPLSAFQVNSFPPSWVKDAIFYQIFPERFANGDPSNDPPGVQPWGGKPVRDNFFGGDLQGIIDHLDYLAGLGVTAIYLNPIFEATTNHKYNTTDYLKIDPHFGDEAVFKKLVNECHARGIKIILDAVFNHTGVQFFAFQDIKKRGARSPYLHWYNIYSLPIGALEKPNYECWWGHGSLPKLMTLNPDVQQYLFEVTRHWMRLGVDGWRLDVPNDIPRQFWIEWRKVVKSMNPEAYIVGEIWEDATPWLQGDQFDAVMNYRFRDAALEFFVQDRLTATQFDSMLARQRADYPAPANYALQNLLGSHDTERFLTLCKGDTAKMKLAVLFQMTYLGAPMIYYGDEVGMEGGRDPGCRGTMVWDERLRRTALFERYKAAIGMRKENVTLRRGDFEKVAAIDSTGIYAFARTLDGNATLVVFNNSRKIQSLTITPGLKYQYHNWRQVWPETVQSQLLSGGALHMEIPPMTGAIYQGTKE